MRASRIAVILLSIVIAGLVCGDGMTGASASEKVTAALQQVPIEKPGGSARAEKGEIRMDLGRYGFRHDPMAWAMSADSLDAAWVRSQVLRQPKPGDSSIIEQEIQRELSQQQPDGYLGEDSHGVLWRLLDLGCAADRPEFQSALQAMHKRHALEAYGLNVACRAGWPDADELKEAVAKTKAEWDESLNFWAACPWHGQNLTQILWSGREYHDVKETVERSLRTMRDHLKDGRHWPIYLDPFGWLECAGYIDHPIAKEIVIAMIPMILRSQKPDGSWGGEGHLGYGPGNHTFAVFRALHKWGLMELLRDKPPLPPEWTITKTIPAPKGELRTMTWDGSRLWVYDQTTGEAIAVSAEDGKVLHSIKLPDNIAGIAWSDESLLATQPHKQAVLYVDPGTGAVKQEAIAEGGDLTAMAKVGGSIWVADNFFGGIHSLDDGKINPDVQWLAGGYAVDMAPSDGLIWHLDSFSRLLILNDPSRPMALIDWAGAPFGHDTSGLAWDGKSLWALDNENNRICVIEKAGSVPQGNDSR